MKKKNIDIFDETTSHDIMSLVTSIKSYAQLLARKTRPLSDITVHEYVLRLDAQIDSLIELMEVQRGLIRKQKRLSQVDILRKLRN